MALNLIPNIGVEGRGKYDWPLPLGFFQVPSAMGQWVGPCGVNLAPECAFHGWEGSFGKRVSGWADSTEGMD